MTDKQILGGRGSAKPFTTLNSIKLMLEIDQLNAENDLLRKTHKTEQDRRRAYEQALTEIKEVLQLYNNTTIGTDKGNGIFEFEVSNDNVLGGKLICCYDTNPAKKALQKISEVLDE